MIDEHRFESIIITNTIVAVFCFILLITLIIFIITFFVPSIRPRWFKNNEKKQLLSLSRQSSFQNLNLGSSRFNPIFQPTIDTTTTTISPTNTSQFGTLFHPQSSIATLLHPTIWTSIAPSSVISSPLTLQSPPPIPSHPPTTTTTTAQRSPKKR